MRWHLDCLVLKLEGFTWNSQSDHVCHVFKNTLHVHACCSTEELNYAFVKSRKQHVGNYEWPHSPQKNNFDCMWGLVVCWVAHKLGITWNLYFTMNPSISLRTSVCEVKKRGVKPFGTNNILLPPTLIFW